MKRPARGFTLIEQIAVITLAGAASAVAVPALVDLQADAEAATLRSLAQAATTAMAINYGGCLVSRQTPEAGKCAAVTNCSDVSALLLADLPAGYRVADLPLGAHRANGVEGRCALTLESTGAEAGFVGISAGR